MNKKYIPFILIGALLVLPQLGLSSYVLHILILALMWATAGMAWNLLGGYCGQVSFGHAAFFGMGAYCAGLLAHHYDITPWLGFLVSVPVVAALALVMGFIVLRLRGPYFVLATLAIGELLRIIAENLVDLTQGNLGVLIRRTWVDKDPYYYVILALALGTYFLIQRIMASRWGYYFVAIREDQDAAESLGINTTLYKTIALAISAVITGFTGAFYMNYMGYIDPQIVFSLGDISIVMIMVVMVGGVATPLGPWVGAVIMVILAEWIRSLPVIGTGYQTLFGILLIVIIIFLPNGLVGDLPKIKRFFKKEVPA
ncbi:MAG: branched-chain amino acid ABC transporter permease [Proteobacteria bacterium]|nr:branched-chain amino acid ABC transporter permease [Pseudomonadota bacterium]MBU1596420.1 branched-chain amino acid ABC transporter permease [Pseudomonadota bacterium]